MEYERVETCGPCILGCTTVMLHTMSCMLRWSTGTSLVIFPECFLSCEISDSTSQRSASFSVADCVTCPCSRILNISRLLSIPPSANTIESVDIDCMASLGHSPEHRK